MNSVQILMAMNNIKDAHIVSAQKRLGLLPDTQETIDMPRRRSHTVRRMLALVAAVLLLMTTLFTTAMAVSEDFRDFVFGFFKIEQPEKVPEYGENTAASEDFMSVEQERANIGGVIEGIYVHAPEESYARNGVFSICTDGPMMNSGNHFDAYKEENGELVKLEERTFCQDYTVLGTDIHVEFQWAEHNGYAVITYIDSDAPFRMQNMSGGINAALIQLAIEGHWMYPVLIDLETGSLTDVLNGTGAEDLDGIKQTAISEDFSKMLIASSENVLYYGDLTNRKLYSVEELSGERADACSLIGNTLACWVQEGASIEEVKAGTYRAWAIDLATLERRELFSSLPATAGTSIDVWSINYSMVSINEDGEEIYGNPDLEPMSNVGLHFLDGFDGRSHWGNMYAGSSFAVEVDENRNVYVIDLVSGEKARIEGYLWPEVDYPDIECIASSDGKKLLIDTRTSYNAYDAIGVLDFEKKTYFEFSRENPNDVHEGSAYWFDNNSIIIVTDSAGDYYVYRLGEN